MDKIDPKEAAISLTKSIFNAVPFAGGALNEVFFEYRSRIKQKRLNSFTELLADFFASDQNIDLQNLHTEEFSDLFESVIRRVLQTQSKEKHLRLRNVLIKQILHPQKNIDNDEAYLDLISTLDETAIWVLNEHHSFSKAFELIDQKRLRIQERINKAQPQFIKMPTITEQEIKLKKSAEQKLKIDQAKIEQYNKQVIKLQDFRKARFYQISDADFMYYKQTLYAKGLLIDKSFGNHGGGQAFRWTWITEYGKKFIEFLLTT